VIGLTPQWEAELHSRERWRRSYYRPMSSSSVAGTARSAGHSPFQGGPMKCASIVARSFPTFEPISAAAFRRGNN